MNEFKIFIECESHCLNYSDEKLMNSNKNMDSINEWYPETIGKKITAIRIEDKHTHENYLRYTIVYKYE